MFKTKCVSVSGNLKQNNISYKLCPNTEFSTGKWQISISVVCLEAKEDINTFCSITSNFSVENRFSSKGELESYEQPLVTFQINLRKSGKSVQRFSNPIWLNINRLSDEILFRFLQQPNETVLNFDCVAVINILFRRPA